MSRSASRLTGFSLLCSPFVECLSSSSIERIRPGHQIRSSVYTPFIDNMLICAETRLSLIGFGTAHDLGVCSIII